MQRMTLQERWRELISPFNTWQYLLVNVIFAAVLAVVFNRESMDSPGLTALVLFWTFSLSFVLWTGNAAIVSSLDRRVPWIESPWKRILSGIVLQSVYSLVAFLTVQVLYQYLFFGTITDDLIGFIRDNGAFPVILSIGLSTLFTVVGFFKSWRESELKAEQLRSEMLKYKYESLRSQLNPHFLFNSFNVLGDLIYEDADQAAKFLQRLSDLYRYVLDSREQELVPLEQELDFARSFAYLLEIRFEGKLEVQFEVEAKENERLIPMSLQLLIENAVKHNEVSTRHPLRVTVGREGNHLTVRNVLRLRDVGDDSLGTGLSNLEAQYALYAPGELQVLNGNGRFEVRVPIIREGLA